MVHLIGFGGSGLLAIREVVVARGRNPRESYGLLGRHRDLNCRDGESVVISYAGPETGLPKVYFFV
jgi:hypothetical protein